MPIRVIAPTKLELLKAIKTCDIISSWSVIRAYCIRRSLQIRRLWDVNAGAGVDPGRRGAITPDLWKLNGLVFDGDRFSRYRGFFGCSTRKVSVFTQATPGDFA